MVFGSVPARPQVDVARLCSQHDSTWTIVGLGRLGSSGNLSELLHVSVTRLAQVILSYLWPMCTCGELVWGLADFVPCLSGAQIEKQPPAAPNKRRNRCRGASASQRRWGFDVSIFSSIDDDELYVCVSLEDEGALESYLLRYGLMLQLRQDGSLRRPSPSHFIASLRF
jgi:hypothetical protein